ncbi:MAG: ABC transporter permease subunit [Crocinitomicaceae bacterium]|jgi:sodium transport system permease protein|tara:strand:+ start:12735 stop:13928 length:1194 start_codon:yes stop_codon:yes gene_type:complete
MIFKIFKKELKDTVRDRRTMLMMLVIPLLLFPVLINIVLGVSTSYADSAESKVLKIGVIGDTSDYLVQKLAQIPESFGPKKIIAYYGDSLKLQNDQKDEKLDLILWYDSRLETQLEAQEKSWIIWAFDKTNLGYADRAKSYTQIIETTERFKRYEALNIDEQKLIPFDVIYENTASDQQMLGELAGGFLPYIFIAFGFMGCMYPAIDLFTGEKERGTIETLLTTPVHRWKILVGKMLVVVLSGLMASFSALIGLFFSIQFLDMIPDPTLVSVITGMLTPSFIVKLFFLLLPLTVFFAGIMVPISVYTKTFKEAQSIIAPMNILVILPAMIGLFPGVELNIATACVPILNIVLTTKSLIAGNIDYFLLTITFLIMLIMAGTAVFISFRQFGKETNILN